MSNYPPGVTGLEPEIAGQDEHEGEREVGECRNLGELVIVSTGGHAQAGVVCDFTGGEVGGIYSGDRYVATFWWVCPSCGTENDVPDLDVTDVFGPDPDERRDCLD